MTVNAQALVQVAVCSNMGATAVQGLSSELCKFATTVVCADKAAAKCPKLDFGGTYL